MESMQPHQPVNDNKPERSDETLTQVQIAPISVQRVAEFRGVDTHELFKQICSDNSLTPKSAEIIYTNFKSHGLVPKWFRDEIDILDDI